MDYQREKDCILSLTKSIKNPDFPPESKPVRAEVKIGGNILRLLMVIVVNFP